MTYELVKNLLELAEQFESESKSNDDFHRNIEGFRRWLAGESSKGQPHESEPEWEGKETGRTPESMIATLLVHMNRYAKTYFKAAIQGSEFATQEDVIYLIVLRFNQPIGKMELIKKNVHEKPAGMQIINRLIAQGWVEQSASPTDKRSKVLTITKKGEEDLDALFDKVRQATNIVTGNLTYDEKMSLIKLLQKLNDFHLPIYDRNYEMPELLGAATEEMNKKSNADPL